MVTIVEPYCKDLAWSRHWTCEIAILVREAFCEILTTRPFSER